MCDMFILYYSIFWFKKICKEYLYFIFWILNKIKSLALTLCIYNFFFLIQTQLKVKSIHTLTKQVISKRNLSFLAETSDSGIEALMLT